MPQGGMEDVCRVVVAMNDPMSHEFSLWAPHDFEELDRLGWGSLHSDGPGHNDLYECLVTMTQKNHLMVPSPCDSCVINVSSEVLLWADSCDLVGKVREAVPVSKTVIVPLQLQVSRYIIGEPAI